MHATAGGDSDRSPGLITVQTNDWISSLSAIGAICARLDDGLRHRNIVIRIGAQQETRVLTRAPAQDRDAPYRDFTPCG